jgi:hypothetical protein
LLATVALDLPTDGGRRSAEVRRLDYLYAVSNELCGKFPKTLFRASVTEIEYHVAALDVPQLAQPVAIATTSGIVSLGSVPRNPTRAVLPCGWPLAAIGAARSPPAALHMNVLDPSLDHLADEWTSNEYAYWRVTAFGMFSRRCSIVDGRRSTRCCR